MAKNRKKSTFKLPNEDRSKQRPSHRTQKKSSVRHSIFMRHSTVSEDSGSDEHIHDGNESGQYSDIEDTLELLGINIRELTEDELVQNYFATEEQSDDTLAEFEYLQQNLLEDEHLIIDDWEDIPDIAQIPEDEEEVPVEINIIRAAEPIPKGADEGKFVDTLTGKEKKFPKPKIAKPTPQDKRKVSEKKQAKDEAEGSDDGEPEEITEEVC